MGGEGGAAVGFDEPGGEVESVHGVSRLLGGLIAFTGN
jgi:hypothetical protein